MLLTIVIPIAPHHEALAERAIQSALCQTLDCAVIAVYDHERRGAGWARNRGLEQTQTDFCTFLDADDWLEPDYAEQVLTAYEGTCYVYSDWFAGETVSPAPDCAYVNGTWHAVTCLLPTEWVRKVGGFDEQLPAIEDTELFVHLRSTGLCGKRLPHPLMHYSPNGQRSALTREQGAEFWRIQDLISERYGGRQVACCGKSDPIPNIPKGERLDGDVLAAALWQGNRQERGLKTGRLYPRTGYGGYLWMAEADIDASPRLFRRVTELPATVTREQLAEFKRLAGLALGVQGAPNGARPQIMPQGAAQGDPKPDYARLVKLYEKVVESEASNK